MGAIRRSILTWKELRHLYSELASFVASESEF